MVSEGKKVKHDDTLKSGKVGWDLALSEAKTKLYKNLAQRKRLYAAIRFFEEKIRANAPWPTKRLLR
jgi:hypothetical protein